MNTDLDYNYFLWLCRQIGLDGHLNYEDSMGMEGISSPTFFTLAQILYFKEFIPKVKNDDNRVNDGLILRKLYSNYDDEFYKNMSLYKPYCSFLEMIYGLTRRMEYNIVFDMNSGELFWMMMHNIGVFEEDFSDDILNTSGQSEKILYLENVIDIVNTRSYKSDGTGGFFPLNGNCLEDQRNVEIWYQMQHYICSNGL